MWYFSWVLGQAAILSFARSPDVIMSIELMYCLRHDFGGTKPSQKNPLKGKHRCPKQAVSLSEIRSEHSDSVIRRELESEGCVRWPEQPAAAAHPCSEINVSVRCCNRPYRPYKKGGGDAGVVRRRRRQDIPVGSSQSIVPYAAIWPHPLGARGRKCAGDRPQPGSNGHFAQQDHDSAAATRPNTTIV